MNGVSRSPLLAFVLPLITVLLATGSSAYAGSVDAQFERLKSEPLLLRDFLYRFPKGGELHTHLDGAVYAESYITWAAGDGKCIDLSTYTITLPPCKAEAGRPPVAQVQLDAGVVNQVIDAMSVRNYEYGSLSGHDQVFATFSRFAKAVPGREGFMIAQVTDRAARQNNHYLELIYITGMPEALKLGASAEEFSDPDAVDLWLDNPALKRIFEDAVATTDRMERQWREVSRCSGDNPAPGCDVTVRHQSAVIRTLPRAMVVAQTVLAFMLVENDPRYVGLNFVAPEDHPIVLRDYDWQMALIARLAKHFPKAAKHITLHAGELAPPLVPPEAMLGNVRKAVTVAGAKRIGHGTDIVYEQGFEELLQQMARDEILVEINLSSNAIILGVSGKDHPFELYRQYGVPTALSTDDEGVARIDITHEYLRAVQTYDLSYADIKALSRNALAYSFLPGENLFADVAQAQRIKVCKKDKPGTTLSQGCEDFLASNEKAALQWQLEQRFFEFEGRL